MRYFSIILLASFSLLTACGNEDAGPGVISTTSPMEAKYSTTDGIIPFPNNLLFSGSTDGTLNITSGITDPNDITNPTVALNALDGFSTVAPISTTFGLPIDAATITASSVRVFEVVTGPITQLFPVGGIAAELPFGSKFKALVSPANTNVLVIKPVVALKSNTNYMVVVTNALKSTSGEGARPSAFYSLLKSANPLVDSNGMSQVPGRDDATAAQLEGLRKLNQEMLGVAATKATPAIAAADVAVAWSFKTQTLNKVLPAIQAASASHVTGSDFLTVGAKPSTATGGLGVLDGYTFATVNNVPTAAVTKVASVVIGAVKLPYYLDNTSASAAAPLSSTFTIANPASPIPTLKSTETVPFLMTIPASAAPATGYPIVIFQHGFTVDKSVVFGVANTLAKAGFATIAIDAVLHGSRTFDMDFVNNTTGAAGADGVADASGTHYLNLTSLLTSRDNIRQSVADLIHLTRLLEIQGMDIVNNSTGVPAAGGDTKVDIDKTKIYFVGHSNGGILGTLLAAVEPNIKTFVLANPGGDYASILQNSGSISPKVNAGLSAKGVTIGSADYNAFFVAAQTVVDDGDPLNYAAAAAAAAKNILLFKTKDDDVVPNKQTDNLSLALGLKQVEATAGASSWPLGAVASGFAGSGFTFFTQGTHSSFLTPSPNDATGLDVITEMQTETAQYLGSALLSSATVNIGATALPSTNAASSIVQ